MFIYLFLIAISFTKYDFPEPLVPTTHILAFLYFSVSNLSILIIDLFISFIPIRIPSSSQSSFDTNGLFKIGNVASKISNCLKIALRVLKPIPAATLSSFCKSASNFSRELEYTDI